MDSQEVLQEYNETPNESFILLLQGGCQDYNETPPQPKIRSTTKKTNFSVEKDILLVNAWLNTSIDPIQGNDQKASKFWDKILENYNDNKKETIVEHTAHSLSNQWCTIKKFTNKLCGFLVQVESTNPSGLNEQDKINKAKAMYREFNNNIIFQFKHCWNLLKTMPKWNSHQSKSKRKSFATSSSSPQDVIHLGKDNNDENASVELERPLGKKASKERGKKRKSKDCGEKEIMMEVLSGLTKAKKRSHEERKREIDTAKEKIIRIKKSKLEVELRKEAREQKKEELEKQKLEVELRKEVREHKRAEFEKEKLEVELRKEAREYKREEFVKEKLDVELRKEAREHKKEDREIMMMDTSHLSEVQLEYIQSLQMKIIKKRKTFI